MVLAATALEGYAAVKPGGLAFLWPKPVLRSPILSHHEILKQAREAVAGAVGRINCIDVYWAQPHLGQQMNQPSGANVTGNQRIGLDHETKPLFDKFSRHRVAIAIFGSRCGFAPVNVKC